MVAKYELESDAIMINNDRTKFALLTHDEYIACSNNHVMACNPKSAIYQVNLSRACILAIFLKHADNMKLYCKSTVVLDTRLPLAMYIQSGIWVIATRREMKFTVVCQDPLRNQGDVTVRAPFGVIKLNMSCRASNSYFSLPAYYEQKVTAHIDDAMGLLLELRNMSSFSLWNNFTSTFPKLASLTLPSEIKGLKEIPMHTFINYMHDYDEIRLKGQSTSPWMYVSIIISIFILMGIIILCCCKRIRTVAFKHCQTRFPSCCSDGVVEARRVESEWSVASEGDGAVSSMPGGRISAPHDPDEDSKVMTSVKKKKLTVTNEN